MHRVLTASLFLLSAAVVVWAMLLVRLGGAHAR